MSELPPGWALANLPDMLTQEGVFCDGDWVESKDQDPAGDVRLIQLADVGDGSYRNRSARFLTSSKAQELRCTFLQPGDVLIARMPDPLGRACSFPGDSKACVTVVDVCVVRPGSGGVSPLWLIYTVNSPRARRAMVPYEMGTTRKRISRKNLARIPLPVPPLAEQERIVAAIEEHFSRLDAAVAALERVRRNLIRMRNAVLHAAVTGGLIAREGDGVPFEVLESDGPLSAHLSNENARKVNRAKADLSHRSWQVPPSWRWLGAAEVCEVVTSGSTPSSNAMTAGHGEVPYIKVYNLTNRGVLDFSVRPTFISHATNAGRLSRSRLQPGDILTNIVGPPLGKVALVPGDYPEWNTNQAVVVFRPVRRLHPLLLKYWLLSPPVLALLKSTSRATAGQFNVSLTTCRALPLPIPPRAEQEAIVDSIEEHLSRIESQEQVAAAALIHTTHLRSAILAAAFFGKLVVQDPNDEPASVLLERIAAERASSKGHRTTNARKPRTTRPKVLA